MNYLMVKRELETLSKDLAQLAEDMLGSEPPPRQSGGPAVSRLAKPDAAVKNELDYISSKLEAISLLMHESQG